MTAISQSGLRAGLWGAALSAIAATAACSGSDRAADVIGTADVNAAAAAAQADIDRYAAAAAARPRTGTALRRPAPTPVVAPAPSAAATLAAGDPVQIVNAFFEAVAAGDHTAAERYWDRDERDGGSGARRFLDGLAGYASVRATPGTAGRIEAGAGQRYVTVPVRVLAAPAEGGRLVGLDGSLLLHRTADIDGATAEQRQWRIVRADLTPRPTETSVAR